MNPRHRRLLIPGLLVALVVVAVVASLVRRADAAEGGHEVVSRIGDARITEASGMALSPTVRDLAYVMNDSGNAPVLYAVKVSTGAVVGTTNLQGGSFADVEALAIDRRGRLWIADTGDNAGVRDDVALYAMQEPGTGSGTATPTRYPVSYADGPQDVEALLADPRDGRLYLASKRFLGGEVYRLPSTPRTSGQVLRPRTSLGVPGLTTDGAFTPDGRHVVVRTYSSVVVLDAGTWRTVETIPAGFQEQAETLAVEESGRSVLLGTEGEDSTLVRLPLDLPEPAPRTTASPAGPAEGPGSSDDGESGGGRAEVLGGVAVVAVALAAVAGVRALARRT